MSKLEVIATVKAPKAIGPYAQAIAHGELLFCSGQIPLDPQSMNIESAEVKDQAKQVLTNLSEVLKAGGASLESVVKTTIFITDMADFAAVNEVYANFFTSHVPARSTVQVAGLPRGAKVEIEAIAVRK